jgi:hypothetical protein
MGSPFCRIQLHNSGTAQLPRTSRAPLLPTARELLWASKGARRIFNYDLVNSPNPSVQSSPVWRVVPVPRG